MNDRIVGKIHFGGMICSLGKEIVDTTRERLIRRDKLPSKSYHSLAEIARAPGTLKKFLIAPFHDIVECLRCDSDAFFNAKVAGSSEDQAFSHKRLASQ